MQTCPTSHHALRKKKGTVKATCEGRAKRRGKVHGDGCDVAMHVNARNRSNSRAKSITLFAAEFLQSLYYQLLIGSGVARWPLLFRNKVKNRFSPGVWSSVCVSDQIRIKCWRDITRKFSPFFFVYYPKLLKRFLRRRRFSLIMYARMKVTWTLNVTLIKGCRYGS